MLTTPHHIPSAITTASLTFNWSGSIAVAIRDPDEQPQRLAEAIWAVNYKAKAALALVCLEWTIWRLSGHVDVTDAVLRLEAAWAGTYDNLYIRSLDFDDIDDESHVKGNPDGPRQSSLMLLDRWHFAWDRSRSVMERVAIMSANLAQRVQPDSASFEPWLQRCLAALTTAYPCSPRFDRNAKSFDHSGEPSISRAWFDTLAVPPDAVAERAAWDSFLRGLRPADNPYLRPADEMLAEGFTGAPYQAN